MIRHSLARLLAALLTLLPVLVHSAPAWSEEPYGSACRFTVYVGLNDGESYRQEISSEKAESIINGICSGILGSYTLLDAKGVYFDGAGTTFEKTVVIVFIMEEEEGDFRAECIAKSLAGALNQSCVLIEKTPVRIRYVEKRKVRMEKGMSAPEALPARE